MENTTFPFKNQQNIVVDLGNFNQENFYDQKSPIFKDQYVEVQENKAVKKKATLQNINPNLLQVESLNGSESSIDIDQQNDIVNDLDMQYNLRALRLSPTKPNVLSHKQRVFHANYNKIQGNKFFKQNNFQDSIDQYKQGLALLNPEEFYDSTPEDFFQMSQLSSNILFNMGTCYFVLMSYKESIKYYNQSILIKPTYLKAIQKRAEAKYQLGMYAEALIDIQNAHNLDINNVSISFFLTKLLQKLGRVQPQVQIQQYKALKIQQTINSENQQFQSNIILKPILSQSVVINRVSKDNFLSLKNQIIDENLKTNAKKKSFNFENLGNRKQRYSLSPQPISSRFVQESPTFNGGSQYSKKFYNLLVPKKKYSKKHKPLSECKNKSVLMQNSKDLFKLQEKKILKKSIYSNIVKQKKDKVKQQKQPTIQSKIWNYVPFAVFTGIGLYHSVKSFLGK